MTTEKNWSPVTHDELDTLRETVELAMKRGPGWMESLEEARDVLEAIHPKPTPEPEPEPEPAPRGILAYIYRNGPDASNGGISSRCERVIVTGPGVPEIFAASEDCPAVEVATIKFNSGASYHLRPAGEYGKQYMAGGSFVFTSDSRFRDLFPFYGAVPLHDRYEG